MRVLLGHRVRQCTSISFDFFGYWVVIGIFPFAFWFERNEWMHPKSKVKP
jgi:hypothetical protein